MNEAEKLLNAKKIEIDNIEAPEELEDALRGALDSVKDKSRRGDTKGSWAVRHKVLTAAAAIFIIFMVCNYDVFAYYGKKILGYDEVTFGSIKQLNEIGSAQEISKTYRFKNGCEVSVDGVMMDENKLVVMYSVRGRNEQQLQSLSVNPLQGTLGRYEMEDGYGVTSDDKKEIKWIESFDAPIAFDRNLIFSLTSFSDDVSKGEVGKVRFKLDMNKALKRTVKCSLNQAVEFEGTKYKFETLSATPMSVVIRGSIEVSSAEEKKLFTADLNGLRRNLHLELLETYLKDGVPVTEKLQGGMSGIYAGNNGITFDCQFDGLKPNLKTLVLNVVKAEDIRIIERTIDVSAGEKNIKVVPDTEELYIKEVKEENGNTVVTFSAQKDVAFGAALMIDGKQADAVSESSKEILKDGQEQTEKTCIFNGTGDRMQLMFKTLSHETSINKQITIYQSK